jgi:hypothetical protein
LLNCNFYDCLSLDAVKVWEGAVAGLAPNPVDTVYLYLNRAVLAALPSKVTFNI